MVGAGEWIMNRAHMALRPAEEKVAARQSAKKL